MAAIRKKEEETRMWANAQRDDRPAVFNAAVWLTPTILECRAA